MPHLKLQLAVSLLVTHRPSHNAQSSMVSSQRDFEGVGKARAAANGTRIIPPGNATRTHVHKSGTESTSTQCKAPFAHAAVERQMRASARSGMLTLWPSPTPSLTVTADDSQQKQNARAHAKHRFARIAAPERRESRMDRTILHAVQSKRGKGKSKQHIK